MDSETETQTEKKNDKRPYRQKKITTKVFKITTDINEMNFTSELIHVVLRDNLNPDVMIVTEIENMEKKTEL